MFIIKDKYKKNIDINCYDVRKFLYKKLFIQC